jgi:hypothetical protein
MPPFHESFWAYAECPRGIQGGSHAHRRLGLVHGLRDGRHACIDVINPETSTTHRRSVAIEDTTADQAPSWIAPLSPAEDEELALESRVAKALPENESFEAKVVTLFAEAADLLLRKHQDYGPSNIAGAPGGPLNGLRVRLYDKTARLNHLLDSGNEPEFETLIDTFMDIANYGLIGVLVQRGDWPSE